MDNKLLEQRTNITFCEAAEKRKWCENVTKN